MSGSKSDGPDISGPDSESNPEAVPEVLRPTLEALPPQQRREVIEIISQRESHSGPLPSPAQLKAYDEVLPGLAERIVQLTEKEQTHRHTTVDFITRRESRIRERGQICAMIALVIMIGFCAYLVSIGSATTAGFVAVGLIAAVVGIFVTGRHADIKEAKLSLESQEE